MQQPLGTAQTEQWSWILQTVWGWIWAGLSWILDWQALVFRTVLSGDSFWQIVGKFLLLFFPATVLVAGVWGTMVSIFTFTLRPTMSELLSDLTGYQVNALALVVLLWFFLFIIIGGSFACIQVLNEAIKTRAIGQIVSMVLVELAVALFEVLFLYRELIDAITPWLAQQGFQLGIVGTLGLALLGWVGVRGMTWFLFGRFGTPALLAILGRKAMEGLGAVRAAATADVE